MNTNKIQSLLQQKINEAVSSLVDLNSEDVSKYRHIQGIIHGLRTASFIVRSLEAEEREDDDV